MTEAEWLASADPTPILEFLRGKASDRKLRLFAVACCRCICHLLSDERNRRAIDVAERYADKLVPKKVLKAARRKTLQVRSERPINIGQDHDWGRGYAEWATDGLTLGPHESAKDTAYHAATALAYGRSQRQRQDEQFRTSLIAARLVQTQILHDIFSYPFRPVTADPSWRTSTVVSLARQMYDSRDFSPMPILADALQDAGCSHPDVLAHCRGAGPHVRGCWVVDLLLGKS